MQDNNFHCEDCYKYLKDEWGVDCGVDCDYEEAKKLIKKVMLRNHPDRHMDDFEKYNDPKEIDFHIAVDNARRALSLCSPIRNLPEDKYEIW